MSQYKLINSSDVYELESKLKDFGFNAEAQKTYDALIQHKLVKVLESVPSSSNRRYGGCYCVWELGLFSDGNIYLYMRIMPPYEQDFISSTRIKFVRKATKEEICKYLPVDSTDLSA